ncbi:fluoride efflux transporter CrcB [Virgibacillus soli]|uniref:Fluoride-specific ion channel FluC n=1 Tax=Paracerasibacillus soli TaxID=480284 RepID=A0ABU5CR24_9BACI|nr:fluoride efflux transporter CrcB [Virgibacillus soli]MDY0408823.1 fluoride efflux transporter CrcB [Virgibacillus soli]
MSAIFVAIGGFFGSILRYYLSHLFHKQLIGTWIANITGSVLLGLLVKLHVGHVLPEVAWYIFGVGFCGAYTTFSTFGNETMQLLLDKHYIKAFSYVFISLFVSLLLVYAIFNISFPTRHELP